MGLPVAETEAPAPKLGALTEPHRMALECHVLRRDRATLQAQLAHAAVEQASKAAKEHQAALLAFVGTLGAEYGFDARRDELDVASGKITRKDNQ